MKKSAQKERTGVVIGNKMKKTIVVSVERLMRHAKYGKVMKKRNKFKVHDEKNAANVGDIVRIAETKPISKDKHFRLVEVIRKAHLSQGKEEEVLQ